MKERATTTIKAYLERSILKQSAVGFTAIILISMSATFFLSRYKMATDLQKSAIAAATAFHSRVIEGDAKAVESQIHELLGLSDDEEVSLLKRDFKRIYQLSGRGEAKACDIIGSTCFDGYTGPGRIFIPIYYDEQNTNLYGYLYISKSVAVDWLFVVMVFSVFSLGYAVVLFGLRTVSRASSKRLATDVEEWAQRLKCDPKNANPLSIAPFSELTPLKEAIEGLNAKIENYESKAEERAKMLILRGIAHDLLSPVSQVQLYIATLEKQIKFEPFAQDTLSEIKSSLRTVSMIASQVKSLNESSDIAPNMNLVDAARMEVEALQKTKSITEKGIRLNFHLESHDAVLAPLSQSEVTRILQNLVENAAHASQAGSEINVAVSNHGNRSVMSVEDSGHGIPRHLRERVFAPDFTSKPSSGTGLGLFIVRHICEQNNGSVEILSSPHRGTTVRISFPSAIELGGLDAV